MPINSARVVTERGPTPKMVGLAATFCMGITEVAAAYTLTIAAAPNIVVTADVGGVGGNALDFQATADGLAVATFDFSSVLTLLDSVLTFGTGGIGGNAWEVAVVAGSGGGEGCNIYEDTANKVLTIMYEDGVTTVANVATAVATSVNFTCVGGTGANVLAAPGDDLPQTALAGGTPQEWAEQGGTPVKMHLHYEATVTTGAEGVIAINAVVGKSMTATGGDANAMAGGDAVAKQDLSGGVDEFAVSQENGPGNIDGTGAAVYALAKTGTGEYTITFADPFPELLHFKAQLHLGTASDQYCLTGAYDPTAKTILIYIWDKSAAAVADPELAADNTISFRAMFSNHGG